MLELLARAKVCYLDATFKVVKNPFSQLFSIHAFVKHGSACKQVPLVFVLMSNCRNSDYLLVLKEIQNILPANPSVTKMVLDFEIAMWPLFQLYFLRFLLWSVRFIGSRLYGEKYKNWDL